MQVFSLSDDVSGSSSYSKTGSLRGRVFLSTSDTILHKRDWHSSKQKRISFSSAGAEVLAAAYMANRAMHMSKSLVYVFAKHWNVSRVNLALLVDSNGLLKTMSTLHIQRDVRLIPTFARFRYAFEYNETKNFSWIPGPLTLTDALTKGNTHSFKYLNRSMRHGELQEILCEQI